VARATRSLPPSSLLLIISSIGIRELFLFLGVEGGSSCKGIVFVGTDDKGLDFLVAFGREDVGISFK
jgi:hypothetical protein